MTKNYHMCINIRGFLEWPKREFDRSCKSFTDADGLKMTPDQVRNALYNELQKGHEVIPMGEACDGFDYKTGCPGHEVKEDRAL